MHDITLDVYVTPHIKYAHITHARRITYTHDTHITAAPTPTGEPLPAGRAARASPAREWEI
jgi:hypothetical protein